jgi:hypothetical protein
MIFITAYFCYAVSLLFIMGCATRRLLEKICSPQSFAFPPNLVNILTFGMISLTTFISFVSIVLPITLYVHISVIISLSAYIYLDKKYVSKTVRFFFAEIKNNPYLFALGCMCIFPVIIMASAPVGYFDTGLYHAQAVKWINEYGTVPGLGNLHHRLAFNSSWFYFSAFFDILAFDGKTAHVVNIIPIALGLMLCLSGFHDIARGNSSLATILKCLLAFPLCTDRALMLIYLPTLSPDLVVVILTLHVMILVVGYIEKSETATDLQENSQHEAFIIVVCISFFLPTIKLNGFPALLFPLFLLIKSKAEAIKMAFTTCLVGGLVLLPFLVNNVILSGYLIFPFPQIDLFSFDWKMPYKAADTVRNSIRHWAIYPTHRSVESPLRAMNTLEWMRFWYARQAKHPLLLWMTCSFVSAIIFFAMCSIRKLKICLNLLAIQGILLIGIMFWFFSAPAFRFGKGWIWGFIMLSFGALFNLILKSVRPQFVSYLGRFIGVLVCIAFINLLLFRWDTLEVLLGKNSKLLWAVSPLPKAHLRAVKTFEGLVVHVPPKEVAWNADLPSSPRVSYYLQMRGKTLKKGFRIAQ